MERPWRLSKEEYDKLLKFLGYGNFRETDIIIFGNEEGCGGYSYEANVKARCNGYGKDRDGNYANTLNGTDWSDGYWEMEEMGDTPKIADYLLPGEAVQTNGFTSGGFLSSTARVCLELESENNDADHYFQSFSDNRKAEKEIKDYIVKQLFKKRNGIQTSLVDWGPLPRKNMNDWPEEYVEIAEVKTNNPYLRAFHNPLRKNQRNITSFSNFNEDVELRSDLIKSLINFSKARVMISFGGANGFKKAALEKMYGKKIFEPLKFKSVDLDLAMYKAKVTLANKDFHIFLLPFPMHGRVFPTQADLLSVLKEFTMNYIKPIIDNKS